MNITHAMEWVTHWAVTGRKPSLIIFLLKSCIMERNTYFLVCKAFKDAGKIDRRYSFHVRIGEYPCNEGMYFRMITLDSIGVHLAKE